MANILAIDDEKDILALIKNALQKEHSVTCKDAFADDLLPALTRYDLILLDIMMPVIDGFDVLTRIRERVDCPIVFLTAKSAEDDVAFGLSLGADDYIKKPFSVVELRARVDAHLRRERREKTAVYESGGVRFYPLRRQAYADDVLLPLTKSEYDIALFLARYHGQVFDRERIYENVFGYEKDGNDTVIAEHIKNIRRKLAQVDRDPIETVWGVGYRWRG